MKTHNDHIFELLGVMLMLATIFLTGCQKKAYVPMVPLYPFAVNQGFANATQPAQFFVCGNSQYPCNKVTPRFSEKKNTIKEYKK